MVIKELRKKYLYRGGGCVMRGAEMRARVTDDATITARAIPRPGHQ